MPPASVAVAEPPVERAAPAGPGAQASTGPARDSQGSGRPLASRDDLSEESAEKRARRQERKRRRQQRRRKHGRNR
jgi:hypothetical protein